MTSTMSGTAKTDAAVALLFAALCGWSLYAANEAAADAVRRYGHNVDSGAYVFFLGLFYFAPLALLFSAAAFAHFRNWRFGKWVHRLAITCTVAPVAFAIVMLGWQSAL